MKKTVIAMTVLACTSLPALAESVDVIVKGTITPASCTPQLGGGGVIDYGTIHPNTLSQTDYTKLPGKEIPISITCDAPAKVALKATSMRPGSTAGATERPWGVAPSPVSGMLPVVGLGLDGSDKIGGYSMGFTSVLLDGNVGHTLYQNDDWDNNKWSLSPSASFFSVNNSMKVSWSTAADNTPQAFEAMSGTIRVDAYLNKASELDLSKPVALDGLTTIEMIYL